MSKKEILASVLKHLENEGLTKSAEALKVSSHLSYVNIDT